MFKILLLLACLAAAFYWVLPAIEHKPTLVEQKVEQQLNDLNRQVSALQSKSQSAGKKTRQQVADEMAALRRQIQETEMKLKDLQNAGRSRWASARELWNRWFSKPPTS